MNSITSIKKIILSIIIVLAHFNAIGQNSNNNESKADIQREEVQRYFGYEKILPAYLTLPMDVTQNTNQRGNFVEVGYLFTILLPILLLFRLRRRNKIVSGLLVLLFLFLSVVYVATTYILGDQSQFVKHGFISSYLESNNSISEKLLGQFYIGNNIIGDPILKLFSTISGTSDYITYPILLILLIGLITIFENSGFSKRNLRIGILTIIFTFFWLVLSSGIPWYGFLMIPLMLIIIFLFIQDSKSKLIKYSSYCVIASWVLLSFVNRVSPFPITGPVNPQSAGIQIMTPIFLDRSMGTISADQVINKIHPSLGKIRKNINRERNSLILQIGTTLGYFIENNPERCLLDFQLGFTDRIIERYETKREIAKALKAGGFRYILIDLNTHTLDRTPERTLTRKFNKLLNIVNNNDFINLIGTDRVVKNPDPNASNKNILGLNGTIVRNGSYAVYEIY